MLHDTRAGSATAGRAFARLGGVWEAVGILAGVIPCGILAGLYLATGDAGFILACLALAALAVAVIFMRRPRPHLRRRRAGREGQATTVAGRVIGSPKLREMGAVLGRTLTMRVLKVLGFAVWMLAWGVTAAFYARVVSNPNMGVLVTIVLVGGLSPVVIYFGLETGVRKLTGRMRDRQ